MAGPQTASRVRDHWRDAADPENTEKARSEAGREIRAKDPCEISETFRQATGP